MRSASLSLGAGWRNALLALAALWLAIGWMFRDTAVGMITIWDQQETYAHAWIVPPMAVWLAWRARAQVLAIDPQPAPWFLLPIAMACALWLTGQVVAVAPATQFAFVALLVLAVPAVLGARVARVLAFPLGFLFFGVPVGEFLTPTLMHWTAEFTIAALRLSGIPVYQEGLMFVIPSGSWSVIDACSGIRYLIASVMVGTLFAYLNYTSLRRRLLFVGVSIIVPLVANWLRAYMIVMLGHLSNNTIAVGADHLLYGWVFFGIVIIALYWIGARWAQNPEPPKQFAAASGRWPVLQGWVMTGLVIALMSLAVVASHRIASQSSNGPVSLSLPEELPGGWRLERDPAPGWQPAFKNPVATLRTAYRSSGGATVGVFIGYYRNQDQQRKLVSTANRLIANEDHGWNRLAVTVRQVPSQAGLMQFRQASLLQAERPGFGRQRLQVWQTYWIDGEYMDGDAMGKLRGAWSRLLGRGDDSAVILLFADHADEAAADAGLADFVNKALPTLTAVINAPRLAALAE